MMMVLAVLIAFAASTFAHGGYGGPDLAHEHPGGLFRGLRGPVGCNAPNLTAGEPAGMMQNLTSDIQAYIASPRQRKKPSSAVIYLSDIFGLPLDNNKLLADAIAAAGFLVVFPDLFAGDAVPVDAMGTSSFNFTAWRERHPVSAVDDIVTATIEAVNSQYGYEDIGAVGYCFGGKYVARFLTEDGGLSAGFAAHPSGLTADELEAIAHPMSLAYAGKSSFALQHTKCKMDAEICEDNDNSNPPEARTLAEQTFNETGITWQATLYSGTGHGFAVRANTSDPQQLFAQESAYLQAVRWLDSWI